MSLGPISSSLVAWKAPSNPVKTSTGNNPHSASKLDATTTPSISGSAADQSSKVTDPSESQSTTATVSFTDSAKAKVKADYDKASAQGTRIVADVANGGRFLDLSSLNDEELAAVALNKGKSFSNNEIMTAKGEFTTRLAATLLPFSGNVMGNTLAVKAIYPTLSQDVRDAMGWNQQMLDMGDRIIRDLGGSPENTDFKSMLEKIAEARKVRNALNIDVSSIQSAGKGSNVSMIA